MKTRGPLDIQRPSIIDVVLITLFAIDFATDLLLTHWHSAFEHAFIAALYYSWSYERRRAKSLDLRLRARHLLRRLP